MLNKDKYVSSSAMLGFGLFLYKALTDKDIALKT